MSDRLLYSMGGVSALITLVVLVMLWRIAVA